MVAAQTDTCSKGVPVSLGYGGWGGGGGGALGWVQLWHSHSLRMLMEAQNMQGPVLFMRSDVVRRESK
jgi:hypothetical protein